MKKVLVTGSLGYIGSVLTQYLRGHNFSCIGYDIGFFKDCTLYAPDDGNTTIGDMRRFDKKYLKDVDVVVHLAGISNDPFGHLSPEDVYDPTREYSLKLAKLCKDIGVKFIFASSCSVYGRDRGEMLKEESEPHPLTPYSMNKLQIESDLKKITDNSFSPIILRFATAFGISPRMRFDIVINMLTAMAYTTKKIILNSDGKAWRPNVHILDICKAIKYSIDLDFRSDKPLILNIGSTKENYPISQIAQMIKESVSGAEIIYLEKRNNLRKEELIRDRKVQDCVDKRNYKVSFEKVKDVFDGFRCDCPVKRGIESMLEYFGKIRLSENQFKNIDFYRLQKMENLFLNQKYKI